MYLASNGVPTFALGPSGVSTNPALQFLNYATSGVNRQVDFYNEYRTANNLGTHPSLYISGDGGVYSENYAIISGRSTGSGATFSINPPTNDLTMLALWSDVVGPTLVIAGSNTGPLIYGVYDNGTSASPQTGKFYTWCLDTYGSMFMAPETNASNTGWDTGISRLSPGLLAIGNGTRLDFTGSLQLANASLINATASYPVGAPALVVSGQAYANGSDTTVTLDTISTPPVTLIVAVLSGYAALPTIADSKSNSWTYLPVEENASGAWTQIAYCYQPITNAAHVFTPGGGGGYTVAFIYAFSGAGTLDGSLHTGSTSGFQPGSITPNTGDVVICGFGITGSAPSAATVASGVVGDTFATPQTEFSSGISGAASYFLSAVNSAVNPTWTVTGGGGSTKTSNVIACFAPSVVITNFPSPVLTIAGTVWNGSASVADIWTVQDVVTNAANGASTLTFLQSGSSGYASVYFPNLALPSGGELSWNADSGISRLGAASLAIGNGVAGNTSGNLSYNRVNLAGADHAGTVTITAAATTQAVSYAANYTGTAAPVVVATPTSDPLALGVPVGYWVTPTGSAGAWTGFTMNIQTALAGNVTFNYIVVGKA
jgi:hypothetical protein